MHSTWLSNIYICNANNLYCPKEINGLNMLQQKKNADFADFISDDLPLRFDQNDIIDFRINIGAAILRGNINCGTIAAK